MKEIIKRILIKLTSTKFCITLWAVALITVIALKNIDSMNNIALALTSVPVSYFIANTIQKRGDHHRDE
ncbi:MAG: hypothetical protein U0L18_09070 [Acutalibacteraceae bacterium]|nr:hypothetical protein [Acutalibacteraceae bacterium]